MNGNSADSIAAQLAAVEVLNPQGESVQMGSLWPESTEGHRWTA